MPVVVGMVVAAVGMVMLTQLNLHSGYFGNIFPGLLVMGLGIGAIMGTAFGAATQGVNADDAGVVSAVVNTVRQIGGSIGTAVLSAVFAAAATNYLAGKTADAANAAQAAMNSYTTAFWWTAAIFAVGAVVCGLLLPYGPVAVDPNAPKVSAH